MKDNLKIILNNPEKTSDVVDLIQKEIKEESIRVYDRLYLNFKGGIEERRMLNRVAEREIEIISFDIRNKYFNTL